MKNSSKQRFPIARKVFQLAGKARANWLLRHQTRFSFWIHMVGIPMAIVGLIGFAVMPWEIALGLFFAGYLLQWIGHMFEGNDVGELIPLKRALGLNAISIAPQFQTNKESPK
jgi:hypothetical protein